MEGGPVIGCGALFISWSSAWGGRCGPVYKSDERENGGQVKWSYAYTNYQEVIVTFSSTVVKPNGRQRNTMCSRNDRVACGTFLSKDLLE